MPLNLVPRREEVIKRYSEFSSQLSTQCRTLSAGILALTWALMTSKDSPLKGKEGNISRLTAWNLTGIAVLVILVLVSDAVQYLAALRVEEQILAKMGDRDKAMYDRSFAYNIQSMAFNAKLIGLGIAVLWLLVLLAFWFL